MLARSMLLYLLNTFCRYTRSTVVIVVVISLKNCRYSLKNSIVRPTKQPLFDVQKITSFVWHTTIVADSLSYLSKWRHFWRHPIWLPPPQKRLVWIRHWIVRCGRDTSFPWLSALLQKGQILPVACRGLVIPGVTAWLYAPPPNSSIEQWRMVVIVTGYTLVVTSQYDVIFTFANQRFGEVCWCNLHIILHVLSLLVVVQCVTVMYTTYQRSKFKTQDSTVVQKATAEYYAQKAIAMTCIVFKFSLKCRMFRWSTTKECVQMDISIDKWLLTSTRIFYKHGIAALQCISISELCSTINKIWQDTVATFHENFTSQH